MANMQKPKHVLIVNVHSSDNAGDLALLLQTISYLEQSYGVIQTSICTNWPNGNAFQQLGVRIFSSPWRLINGWGRRRSVPSQFFSFLASFLYLLIFKITQYLHIKAWIPSGWFDLFSAYQSTDMVVAVSGNQIFSTGKYGWPLPVVCLPVFLGLVFRKPTIVFPQSVGPFKFHWEEWLVKTIYNRVDKLFIRDIVSLERMKELGIKESKPQLIPDIAFTFMAETDDRAQQILSSYKESFDYPSVGMTIISNMGRYLNADAIEQYHRCMTDVISCLVTKHHFRVFIFLQVHGPTDQENDEIGTMKVINALPRNVLRSVNFVNERLTPSELKACYGMMDVFLATRLHSGIFSLSKRVPTLFVGYLDKTIGVLRFAGLDQYYYNLIEVDSDKIVESLMEMWENKSTLTISIEKSMQIIEMALARFPDILRKV